MNSRQASILDKLRRQERLEIEAEARCFDVSPMTIRRDFKRLAEMNLGIPVQGGIVLRSGVREDVFFQDRGSDAQRRIATEAIRRFGSASTVMLSVGTTTLEIARQLARQASVSPLTVVTNSLPIASVLFRSEVQVVLTGGVFRAGSMDLVGPITEKNLGEFHLDLLVSGCDAADPESGFFTNDLNLAAAERKSVEASDRVMIVTESHKFSRRSFVRFASLDEVSMVVTDSDLSESYRAAMKNRRVEVVLA
jgi:DeoR/GlpR family transcriptional regulator of sugar metabolism